MIVFSFLNLIASCFSVQIFSRRYGGNSADRRPQNIASSCFVSPFRLCVFVWKSCQRDSTLYFTALFLELPSTHCPDRVSNQLPWRQCMTASGPSRMTIGQVSTNLPGAKYKLYSFTPSLHLHTSKSKHEAVRKLMKTCC